MVPSKVAMLMVCVIVFWSIGGDFADLVPLIGKVVLAPFWVFSIGGVDVVETWTVGHLHGLAKTKRIAIAVSQLAGGGSAVDRTELEGRIDDMTPEEIGTALLGEDSIVGDSAYLLTKFVKAVTNAEHHGGDTCAEAGAAGLEGLDACTAGCERKKLMSMTPPAGACYALCSMAVSPCGLRPFTWRRWLKERNWMIGANAIVGAKGFLILCLHPSAYMVAQYLVELFIFYVLSDARVAILTIPLWAVILMIKIPDRRTEAAGQGLAPARPRGRGRKHRRGRKPRGRRQTGRDW